MCFGHQRSHEEGHSQSNQPWGRTHEKDNPAETSLQVFSLQASHMEKQGATQQSWQLLCFYQANKMGPEGWIHICGGHLEGPYVTTRTPESLKYISGKYHHHHRHHGDGCRGDLGNLPRRRGALGQTFGVFDETWEKHLQLPVCHSYEFSLPAEWRENSFKIFITDLPRGAEDLTGTKR